MKKGGSKKKAYRILALVLALLLTAELVQVSTIAEEIPVEETEQTPDFAGGV